MEAMENRGFCSSFCNYNVVSFRKMGLQLKIEAIMKQKKSSDVPEELFQEMQKNLVFFQSKEDKREALKLIDLETVHSLFDEFVQRASKCLPGGSSSNNTFDYSNVSASANNNKMGSTGFAPAASSSASFMDSLVLSNSSKFFSEKDSRSSYERLTSKDDSYVMKAKGTDGIGIGFRFRTVASSRPQIVNSSLNPTIVSGDSANKISNPKGTESTDYTPGVCIAGILLMAPHSADDEQKTHKLEATFRKSRTQSEDEGSIESFNFTLAMHRNTSTTQQAERGTSTTHAEHGTQ